MQPYFIFKGIDSRDMGVVVNKLPPISKSEKNIEKIEVQGRDGFLTQDEDTYKGKIKPIECTLENIDNIDNVCAWLDGSGEVIFSNQPDRYFKATIINQIDFHTPIRLFKRFYLQFECQPFGYLKDEKTVTRNKELLEGLSGNDYDLEKIYREDREHVSIETLDNKKWIKYITNTTSLRLNNISTLKPNTTYTYSFNIIAQNKGGIACSHWESSVRMYGGKAYATTGKTQRINHTFTTQNNITSDVFHITLNAGETYYFSDFRLIEGNGEGINLIENGGAVLDTTKWTKHVGGGATSYDIFVAKKDSYPRTGIGFICQDVTKGWCILANTSLSDRKFLFDIEKEYMVSCVIFSDKKARIQFQICNGGQTTIVALKHLDLEVGYNNIQYTFKPLVEGDSNYVRFALFNNEHSINIFDLKLEEGTKATEWNLSPLDKRLYIENKGTRKSKPTITVYATGDVNLYVNKETVKLKNVEDKITINTEMMEAYKDTMPQNNKMYGEFPIFTIGSNNITWEGKVSRIEAQPNTVFL